MFFAFSGLMIKNLVLIYLHLFTCGTDVLAKGFFFFFLKIRFFESEWV